MINVPPSDEVLFHGRQVVLHRQVIKKDVKPARAERRTKRFARELLDRLSMINNHLAQVENVPGYAILPEPTLKALADFLPLTHDDFRKIPGIGEHKAGKYGAAFLEEIRSYILVQDSLKKPKGRSYIETLNLFRQGKSIEEISQERSISVGTVAAHLAFLYERGEDINLMQFLRPSDLQYARQAWRASGFSEDNRKIKEEVGDSLEYHRLHMAMAILRRERELNKG
jgi:ATP-dependent DNA helicase RecQ